jgi:hypothetical protein
MAKDKGVLLGPRTAQRVLRMTSSSDAIYAPSGVQQYHEPTNDSAPGGVPFITFVLTSGLTDTGTATVETTSDASIIAVGDVVDLYNPTEYPAYVGAVGSAVQANGVWCVVEVNRPSPFLHVTLSCDSHNWTASDSATGFNADQVSPITVSFTKGIDGFPLSYGGTVTISNPYNFNWLTGDRALLRKQDDSGNYFVIKVFRQTCLRFRFRLTANTPSTLEPMLTATAICPTNSEDGPPPSGTISIKDIFGYAANAKTGHKGVAEYDFNNGWWYVTECQHTAWRFRGTLSGTLTGGASFFNVTPVRAFDGKLPVGTQTVYNMHSWDSGTNGHIVSCEWNPEDGRYEAYQMRCPA